MEAAAGTAPDLLSPLQRDRLELGFQLNKLVRENFNFTGFLQPVQDPCHGFAGEPGHIRDVLVDQLDA